MNLRLACLAILASLPFVLGMGCQPALTVTTPTAGLVHELPIGVGDPAGKLIVAGVVGMGGTPTTDLEVRVHLNGLTNAGVVAPFVPGTRKWETLLSVDYRGANSDAKKPLNTVWVVVHRWDATAAAFEEITRRAVTVAVVEDQAMEWVDRAPSGVAIRLNDTGLDEIAALVGGTLEASVDLVTLIGDDPAGGKRVILQDRCFPQMAPPCSYTLDGTVEGVSVGALTTSLDSSGPLGNGHIELGVDVANLRIDFEIRDQPGSFPNVYCSGFFAVDPLSVLVDLDQTPKVSNPKEVSVVQELPTASIAGYQIQYNPVGACGDPAVQAFIQSQLAADLQLDVEAAVANLLNTPPAGATRPLLEQEMETYLNQLQIGQAIAPDLAMDLDGEIQEIEEDEDGIVYLASTEPAATSTLCDAGLFSKACPNLSSEGFMPLDAGRPYFGPDTASQLPYEMALGMSDAFLNQLFREFAAQGHLAAEIIAQDRCLTVPPLGDPVLNSRCLMQGLEGFLGLTGSEPLRLRVFPTMAPVLEGGAGPFGQHATLQLEGLRIEVQNLQNQTLLASMVASMRAGVMLEYNPPTGTPAPGSVPQWTLDFVVDPCTQSMAPCTDPEFQLLTEREYLTSPLYVLDGIVSFPLVMDAIVARLSGNLASFQVPGFAGFELAGIETARDEDYLALFIDMKEVSDPNPSD